VQPWTVDDARNRFPSAAASVFFDHASVGPISTDVADAMRAVVDIHAALGFQPSWREDMESARADVAALVGSTPQGIAFTQNTSFGLSLVANGLDWRPGDNVVLPAQEFPSNYYPWTNLRERGVEVRMVEAPRGHADIGKVAAAIDRRTRVVAISAVQFSTGYRYDLRPLADACAGGPLLVVDGTQCVGALRFDVQESGADVLAVSSHKWLMGPPGAGFAHLNARARDQVHPSIVGWLTVPDPFAFDYRLAFPEAADRYEPGTENMVGILGLGAAARLMLEFTPQGVEDRVLQITDRLDNGLRAQGYEIISDRSPAARSGILIFKHPERATDDLLQLLVDAGIRCAPRGGGIRFSPHFYNSDAEADLALSVLAANG
jgi:selenocysteine lyase/cysteine desulfurase